ncbi:MAG: TorF family putative porin [Gammaproteobacteria bacterium]|jgi:uncharacterized protein (TIGR02001 family)
MRTNKLALACGAALLGTSALAQAELSANIGVASNYVWRGVTQTDDSAAISGGIDWSHDSGFYVGTWASNVDFGPGSGEVEWDIYGGYGGEFGDFGYDVGYNYYAYPDTDDADFGDIYGSLSWKWLSGGLYYTVNSDVDGPGMFQEGDLYGYLSVSFDLPQDFSVGVTAGSYWFDDDGATVDGEKLDLDYNHYQLDIGKSAGDFGDFTMSFSVADDTAATGYDDDMKVFVSWNKSF